MIQCNNSSRKNLPDTVTARRLSHSNMVKESLRRYLSANNACITIAHSAQNTGFQGSSIRHEAWFGGVFARDAVCTVWWNAPIKQCIEDFCESGVYGDQDRTAMHSLRELPSSSPSVKSVLSQLWLPQHALRYGIASKRAEQAYHQLHTANSRNRPRRTDRLAQS